MHAIHEQINGLWILEREFPAPRLVDLVHEILSYEVQAPRFRGKVTIRAYSDLLPVPVYLRGEWEPAEFAQYTR